MKDERKPSLLAATFYQGNPDRNQMFRNIVSTDWYIHNTDNIIFAKMLGIVDVHSVNVYNNMNITYYMHGIELFDCLTLNSNCRSLII
jgi:hypothetical protein